MMLSGQRRIPEHLEKPLSELVHKNQLQDVPSKQRVVGSNPSRDVSVLHRTPQSGGQHSSGIFGITVINTALVPASTLPGSFEYNTARQYTIIYENNSVCNHLATV